MCIITYKVCSLYIFFYQVISSIAFCWHSSFFSSQFHYFAALRNSGSVTSASANVKKLLEPQLMWMSATNWTIIGKNHHWKEFWIIVENLSKETNPKSWSCQMHEENYHCSECWLSIKKHSSQSQARKSPDQTYVKEYKFVHFSGHHPTIAGKK